MFRQQGGVCAVCKMLPGTGRICVDHIHAPGYCKFDPIEKRKYVRGLVCFMCNTTIGKLERTADGVRNRKVLVGIVDYFKVYALKGET